MCMELPRSHCLLSVIRWLQARFLATGIAYSHAYQIHIVASLIIIALFWVVSAHFHPKKSLNMIKYLSKSRTAIIAATWLAQWLSAVNARPVHPRVSTNGPCMTDGQAFQIGTLWTQFIGSTPWMWRSTLFRLASLTTWSQLFRRIQSARKSMEPIRK
jgi:hypothetical protein